MDKVQGCKAAAAQCEYLIFNHLVPLMLPDMGFWTFLRKLYSCYYLLWTSGFLLCILVITLLRGVVAWDRTISWQQRLLWLHRQLTTTSAPFSCAIYKIYITYKWHHRHHCTGSAAGRKCCTDGNSNNVSQRVEVLKSFLSFFLDLLLRSHQYTVYCMCSFFSQSYVFTCFCCCWFRCKMMSTSITWCMFFLMDLRALQVGRGPVYFLFPFAENLNACGISAKSSLNLHDCYVVI